MSDEFAHHELRVRDAVEAVISPFVASGRAQLEIEPAAGGHGALIRITPLQAEACPLTIHCDAPGELDLYVGRHGLTTHIHRPREWERGDYAALEGELREWLEALIAGSYTEEVRLTHEGEAGEGRGTLQLASGPRHFTYSNAPTIGRRGPWQRNVYAAY